MENLNSSSAFQGPDNHTSTGGGRFPTLPLSGFTFTPNSPTSPSGHLAVPNSPAAFSSQTVPRNPRVVPMITRSQSSCNLPENLSENPYDEVGGGFSSHTNHRVPKKSCSQWDMVGASAKNNHLQVGRPQTDVTVTCVSHSRGVGFKCVHGTSTTSCAEMIHVVLESCGMPASNRLNQRTKIRWVSL